MTPRAPNPLRRYWWLTVVWVTAFAITGILAAMGHRPLLVMQAALVGTFVWFTVGRYPGSERLSVHLVFCLLALWFVWVTLFSGMVLIRYDDPPVLSSVVVPTPDPDDIFTRNWMGVQERGGIRLEILKVSIARKDWVERYGFRFTPEALFQDVPVVGQLLFKVTNTTDKTLAVYPDRGTVVVNTEQIALEEWRFGTVIGDGIGRRYLPGETEVSGLYFGIKQVTVPEVNRMTLTVSGPTDAAFEQVGDDFEFTVDLSSHVSDPTPSRW